LSPAQLDADAGIFLDQVILCKPTKICPSTTIIMCSVVLE